MQGDTISTGPMTNNRAVALGRDNIAVDTTGDVTIYKGSEYPRLDYRSEIDDILSFYTRTFVGRAPEWDRLARFAIQEPSGYLLVEARSGYGKSALVAQIVHRNETRRWDLPPAPALLYFIIRQQGNRHTPVAFLRALNSQLLEILGLSGGVPVDLEALRGQFTQLWSQALAAASAQKPLLLVVDGLDEMAPEGVTIAQLLPSRLVPYVHVIVSSRPNPPPRDQVPLEHPFREAEALSLQTFEETDIRALLQEYRATPESAAGLTPRVFTMTKGEPLFARFVCQEVAAKGEPALARLEKNPPADVEEYFRQQFEQLDRLAEGELTWQILGLLAVALGGMTIEEIAEVLDQGNRPVGKALKPIRRFLLGRERLEIMHPQLRRAVAKESGEREQAEHRRKLLDWCRKYEERRWPEGTPGYILQYYAEHLFKARDKDRLHALISEAWLNARHVRGSHTYTGFLADVDLAWQAAVADDGPDSPDPRALVRLQTARLVVGYAVSGYTDRELEALVWLGRKLEALAHARLRSNATARFTSLMTICEVLQKKGRLDPAVLDETGDEARSIEGIATRDWALQWFAGALVRAGRYSEAESITYTIQDEIWRPAALHDLALALVEVGHIEEAVRAARAIPVDWQKITALRGVVEVLLRHGADERARIALDEALEVARGIPHDGQRSIALSNIAAGFARARDGRAAAIFEEAGRSARAIDDVSERAIPLCDLAAAMAQVADERARTVFGEALEAARIHPKEDERIFALMYLTAALAKTDDDRIRAVFALALAAARSYQEREGPAARLSYMTADLTKAGCFREVKEFIDVIRSDEERSRARRDLAVALARARRFEEALEEARASDALREVAARLVEDGDSRAHAALDEILDAAHRVEDERRRMLDLLAAATLLAEAGDDRAGRVYEEAREVAGARVNEERTTAVRRALVSALADAGFFAEACEIAETIADDIVKAEALLSLTRAYIRTGRYYDASHVARSISHDWFQMDALRFLVVSLAQAGDRNQSRSTFDEAKRVVDTIKEDERRSMALCELGVALSEVEDPRADAVFTEARQVVFSSGRPDRDYMLERLAAALASTGRYAEAEEMACSVEGWTIRYKIAATLVEVGHFEQAEAAIHEIVPEHLQSGLLFNLVSALAGSGHREEADRVARSMALDGWRAKALCVVASAFADARDNVRTRAVLESAATLIGGINDTYWRADLLCEWALARCKAGDGRADASVVDAIAVAQAVTEHDMQGNLLHGLATALARIGRLDEAIEASKAIWIRYTQERTQQYVAMFLIEAGRFPEALQLIGNRELDPFLQALAELAPSFERRGPGLSTAVLHDATAIAGWVRPDWRGIHDRLARAKSGRK